MRISEGDWLSSSMRFGEVNFNIPSQKVHQIVDPGPSSTRWTGWSNKHIQAWALALHIPDSRTTKREHFYAFWLFSSRPALCSSRLQLFGRWKGHGGYCTLIVQICLQVGPNQYTFYLVSVLPRESLPSCMHHFLYAQDKGSFCFCSADGSGT